MSKNLIGHNSRILAEAQANDESVEVEVVLEFHEKGKRTTHRYRYYRRPVSRRRLKGSERQARKRYRRRNRVRIRRNQAIYRKRNRAYLRQTARRKQARWGGRPPPIPRKKGYTYEYIKNATIKANIFPVDSYMLSAWNEAWDKVDNGLNDNVEFAYEQIISSYRDECAESYLDIISKEVFASYDPPTSLADAEVKLYSVLAKNHSHIAHLLSPKMKQILAKKLLLYSEISASNSEAKEYILSFRKMDYAKDISIGDIVIVNKSSKPSEPDYRVAKVLKANKKLATVRLNDSSKLSNIPTYPDSPGIIGVYIGGSTGMGAKGKNRASEIPSKLLGKFISQGDINKLSEYNRKARVKKDPAVNFKPIGVFSQGDQVVVNKGTKDEPKFYTGIIQFTQYISNKPYTYIEFFNGTENSYVNEVSAEGIIAVALKNEPYQERILPQEIISWVGVDILKKLFPDLLITEIPEKKEDKPEEEEKEEIPEPKDPVVEPQPLEEPLEIPSIEDLPPPEDFDQEEELDKDYENRTESDKPIVIPDEWERFAENLRKQDEQDKLSTPIDVTNQQYTNYDRTYQQIKQQQTRQQQQIEKTKRSAFPTPKPYEAIKPVFNPSDLEYKPDNKANIDKQIKEFLDKQKQSGDRDLLEQLLEEQKKTNAELKKQTGQGESIDQQLEKVSEDVEIVKDNQEYEVNIPTQGGDTWVPTSENLQSPPIVEAPPLSESLQKPISQEQFVQDAFTRMTESEKNKEWYHEHFIELFQKADEFGYKDAFLKMMQDKFQMDTTPWKQSGSIHDPNLNDGRQYKVYPELKQSPDPTTIQDPYIRDQIEKKAVVEDWIHDIDQKVMDLQQTESGHLIPKLLYDVFKYVREHNPGKEYGETLVNYLSVKWPGRLEEVIDMIQKAGLEPTRGPSINPVPSGVDLDNYIKLNQFENGIISNILSKPNNEPIQKYSKYFFDSIRSVFEHSKGFEWPLRIKAVQSKAAYWFEYLNSVPGENSEQAKTMFTEILNDFLDRMYQQTMEDAAKRYV